MLEEVLRSLNNWFEVPGKRLTGRFAVEGSALSLPDGWLLEGQYFCKGQRAERRPAPVARRA